MSSLRDGVSGGRARWAALFAALLILSAVPVVAAESSPSDPAEEIAPPSEPADVDPSRLPDAAAVTEAIVKTEGEQEERIAWLASPDAIREREESRLAFAALGAIGAEELLRTVFAEQLAQLNRDPARFLSDAQLLSTSEPTVATVKDEGDGMLFESSLPVRAKDEDGDLRKVDLNLDQTAAGFNTENALVDVQIPESADQPIEVGEKGVAIGLAGVEGESPTRPFGDENAFAAEVLPDTDMLVSPIATGVEIFNVLRSENSPETIRFKVDMPVGAQLRADGEWGVEVVKDGDVLTVIPEPIAVDAQGTDVPVGLRVEGDFLTLTVDHREGEYAMPILLDPAILENNENWIYGQNHNALDMGIWSYNNNGSWWFHGSTYCIYECFGPGGTGTRGLFVSLEGQRSYGANQYGQWSYSAPNIHSYISQVTLGAPYVHADHGCPESQYPRPHNYFGIWSRHGYWVYNSVNSANQPGGTYTLPFAGDAAVFGLGTGPNGIPRIPCWRDLYAGGAHVWLDDWGDPGFSAPSGVPSGWVDGKTQFTISTTASDAGLGVNRVKLLSDGQAIVGDVHPNQCTGTRRSPCPNNYNATFSRTGGSFGQGVRNAKIYVSDPTGKSAESGSIPLKVDLTPPDVTLDGKLATATDADEGEAKGDADVETLRLPVYNLAIKATDEGTETNLEHRKRSGVKDIEIWLQEEGQPKKEMPVPWSPTPSCVASCPKEGTYKLELSKLDSAGTHRLEVRTVDFVGNEKVRDIEFEYYPATGVKDEYLMHYFPLPDGQGGEDEDQQQRRPELAVNVMNGNLVYRQKDLDVESTAALDLEVERYYNSMLPDSEDTEWGEGWTLAETPDLKPTGGSALAAAATMTQDPSIAERHFSLWLDMPTPAGARTGYELNFEFVSANTYDVTLLRWQTGSKTQLASKSGVSFTAGSSLALVDEGATISAWTNTGSGFVQRLSAADSAFEQGKAGVFGAGNIVRISKFKAGELDLTPGIPAALAALPVTEVFDGSSTSNSRFAAEWSALGWAGGGTPKGTTTTIGWRPVDAFTSAANGAFYNKNLVNSGGAVEEAGLLDSSGALESDVLLPSAEGQAKFDPELQATLEKRMGGGFLLIDETGESGTAVAFDQNGETEALLAGGDVKVDYSYEGGELAEIAVEDPATLRVDPSEVESSEPQATEGTPFFHSAFGSLGAGNGQFNTPTDVAIGPEGDLWVADYANNRVQHFNPAGEYLGQFGSQGAGAGQLNNPASIAIDGEGNLWVADKGNSRIQNFSPEGTLLDGFGSLGAGNGQFNRPEGIAIDAAGDIWVSDTYNHRIQKFSAEGDFIEVVAPEGLGGIEPTGIDAGPDGKVWVADWTNNRIAVLSEDGDFELSFGTAGSGPGQFNRPDAIEADVSGNVWVGDQNNGRIERFDQEGSYVDQFGAKGSGPGQFSFGFPFGFAVGEDRRIWVADRNNHRVQRWEPPYEVSEEPLPEDDDPSVEVETEADLVTSVVGEEAGEIAYEHSNGLLTSVDGPGGETAYEYKDGHMSKVTLPNGTYSTISYFPDGRVETVTVALEGVNPKTTRFAYTDVGQRKTEVEVPEAPNITYEIGDDGSLLKWWNAVQPPELILWGNLYDQREKEGALWPGDYQLTAKAEDVEGISSIEIVAGGTLVDEFNCEQVGGPPPECTEPDPIPWIMETESNPPGHLEIEVIATDSDEESTSERFWVDIPEPPPPPAPGTPVAPRFAEIKRFRSEYGLEHNFPVGSQTELNERIFNLINAWHEPDTPLGQVARASMARWGVPLRPEDVAELEHREWLYEVNAEKIEQWVEANSPGTYAGYYMDHAAGGIMRIGFTADQELNLAGMKSTLSLVAGTAGAVGDRLQTYPTTPTVPFVTVRTTAESVMNAIDANPTLADLIVSVEDDEAGRAARIGTTNVAQTKSILEPLLEANAPITVEYEARNGAFLGGRYRNEGRMRAGDYINGEFQVEFGKPVIGDEPCTAGFGAEEERAGKAPRLFLLTAGHCYKKLGQEVWRAEYDGDAPVPYSDAGKSEVGRLRRNAFEYVDPGRARTDGEAIRITQTDIVPLAIWGWDGNSLPTKPAMRARKGNILCYSGAISKNVSCGRVVARSRRYTGSSEFYAVGGYWVKFPPDDGPEKGDSGSPVWNKRTGRSVGLISTGRPEGSFEEVLIAPLIHPRFAQPGELPGILNGQSMGALQLRLGG